MYFYKKCLKFSALSFNFDCVDFFTAYLDLLSFTLSFHLGVTEHHTFFSWSCSVTGQVLVYSPKCFLTFLVLNIFLWAYQSLYINLFTQGHLCCCPVLSIRKKNCYKYPCSGFHMDIHVFNILEYTLRSLMSKLHERHMFNFPTNYQTIF